MRPCPRSSPSRPPRAESARRHSPTSSLRSSRHRWLIWTGTKEERHAGGVTAMRTGCGHRCSPLSRADAPRPPVVVPTKAGGHARAQPRPGPQPRGRPCSERNHTAHLASHLQAPGRTFTCSQGSVGILTFEVSQCRIGPPAAAPRPRLPNQRRQRSPLPSPHRPRGDATGLTHDRDGHCRAEPMAITGQNP